jgi:tetratricopeptide (TPR) repeat protein
MSKQFYLLFSLFLADQSFAQNFKSKFTRLSAGKDTAAQIQLLQSWQQATPDDAELYVAWFNYYFSLSKKEIMRFGSEPQAPQSLAVKDSTENTVAYLSDDIDYDSSLLENGFQYINTGITKHPSRLDMRFGKVYALGQIEHYEEFTNEIVETLHQSGRIKNQWLWTDNKKVNHPDRFLLSTIQQYVVQLYNVGDDQLSHMRRIAETVLKYYPNHVESLSNLAITYGLQQNYDQALESLLKAEKIAPHDAIVLNNIATMYERKGDKLNAIKYYELTAKLGNEDARNAAAQKLKELKN